VPLKKRSSNQTSRPLRKSLLDAGPIIGLFNREDDWHDRCLAFFGELDFQLITTEAVISEVIYFLQKARNPSKAVETLLEDVARGLYDIHFLQKSDFQRIKAFKIKYADQKKLDYADMSLVIAAEDLNLGDIITIDRKDFSKLRWKGTNHFNIIQPDLKFLSKK
jgi:predicted nucleic acid-binding protein